MKTFRWWSVALLLLLLLNSASVATAQSIRRRQAQPDVDLLASIAALRSQTPLASESFTEDLDRWTTGNTARSAVAIQDGMLRIRLKRGGVSAVAFTGLALDDFLLEFSATHLGGASDCATSILFRIQDAAALYAFQVRSTGEFAVSRVLDRETVYLVPPTASGAIHTEPGASNRLGVLADGATLTFLLNDAIVHTLVDDAIERGMIGLGASSFGSDGAEITFDDLTVWSLGELPPVTPTPTGRPIPTPTLVPAATATPAPTPLPTYTPTPTPTRSLTLEDLPVDWSRLEQDFILSNIRLEERKQFSTSAPYMVLVFDVEAKSDLGHFVYMANFYDAEGGLLVNAGMDFTLAPGAFGRMTMDGGWGAGAYGTAEVQLPGSLGRVHSIRFERIF